MSSRLDTPTSISARSIAATCGRAGRLARRSAAFDNRQRNDSKLRWHRSTTATSSCRRR
jgi:hypothetical protein